MNDLNQINANNALAVGEKIPGWRAAGQWVVAEYAGLSFVDAKPFDTEGQARARLAELEQRNQPDERYQLLEPTSVPGEHLVGEVRAIDTTDSTVITTTSEPTGNAQVDTETDANGNQGDPAGGTFQPSEPHIAEA